MHALAPLYSGASILLRKMSPLIPKAYICYVATTDPRHTNRSEVSQSVPKCPEVSYVWSGTLCSRAPRRSYFINLYMHGAGVAAACCAAQQAAFGRTASELGIMIGCI